MTKRCLRQTMRAKREKVEHLMKSQTFRMVLLGLLVVMVGLDVFQTSVVSATGADISDLQREVRELQHENERLDYAIAEARSMQHVYSRLGEMNLVQAEDIAYVHMAGSAVAVR